MLSIVCSTLSFSAIPTRIKPCYGNSKDSVLDHVRLKLSSVVRPALPIKSSILSKTIDGGIRHSHRVVCIIVRKESLTAEGKQTTYLRDPFIESLKVRLIVSIVDGKRKSQSACRDAGHRCFQR